VRNLTATEAARRFADVLDAVELRGETFVVVRRGRAVARIGPAGAGRGAAVKDVLRAAPHDAAWVDEVKRMRAALQIEDRRWSD
jgi:antitoxin (DNA-binding transcriptional repressor) of toxin-antitoxin stability system